MNIGFLRASLPSIRRCRGANGSFILPSPRTEQMVHFIPSLPHNTNSPFDCAVIVALSRAREGMYIMGNATNLSARNKMWREVIEELDKRDSLGTAFPIACQRHPHTMESISKPGQLPRIAPDAEAPRNT